MAQAPAPDTEHDFQLEELTRRNTRLNSHTMFPGAPQPGPIVPSKSHSSPLVTSDISSDGPPLATPNSQENNSPIKSDPDTFLAFFCVVTGVYILLRIDSLYTSLLYPVSSALAWLCSSASLALALYAALFQTQAIDSVKELFTTRLLNH